MASSDVVRRSFAAAALVLCPGIAAADFYVDPYVAAQETYDSNVFSLSRALAEEFRGSPRRADSIFEALAGADASYRFGLQRIYAGVEGHRFDYRQFNELDHDEFLVKAGLNWNAQNLVDGIVEAHQVRRMASFINRRSTELTLERERAGEATLNLNISPQWRLETGGKYYELNSPLTSSDPTQQDFPDFTLRESTGTAAIKYTTEAKLSVGVAGSYGEGRFSGIPDAPRFNTTTGDLTLGYKVTDIDELATELGYTRLEGGGLTVTGFSGDVTYKRDLSALTSIKLEGFRRMDGYLAGADVVVDTGAGGEIAWQPTLKIRLEGGYTFTHAKFQRLSTFSNEPGGRVDEVHLSQVTLGYQIFDWLGMRIFGGYRDRRSNVVNERFNEAYVGGQLRLHYPMGVRGDEGNAPPDPVFAPDTPHS
jgi:hypothetical protein